MVEAFRKNPQRTAKVDESSMRVSVRDCLKCKNCTNKQENKHRPKTIETEEEIKSFYAKWLETREIHMVEIITID